MRLWWGCSTGLFEGHGDGLAALLGEQILYVFGVDSTDLT